MSNNIRKIHVGCNEGFAFDPFPLTLDGKSVFITKSAKGKIETLFEICYHGYGYLSGALKDKTFHVDKFEIGGVGSAQAWKRFVAVILPASSGKLEIFALFENGSVEIAYVDNGVVTRHYREWFESFDD